MKRFVMALIICVFVASPAMADLFTWGITAAESWYDGTTFTSDEVAGTSYLTVTNLQGGGSAFLDSTWPVGAEDFALSMLISNVGAGGTSADGVGTFTLTDVDSDLISGNLSGTWALTGNALNFNGVLSSVAYTPVGGGNNTAFDGDFGTSASMLLPGAPWPGTIIHLVLSGLTFNNTWGDGTPADEAGGVVDGGVTAVITPVPAAVILGMLGLAVAGWKLRKYA